MLLKYLNYFNFYRLFLGVFFKKKYPLAISWAITKRCNMHCLYCSGGIKEEELTTEQIIKIISEAHRAGTRFISFTGGEPLLREDIKDLINHAKNQGIFVKLNTNGYLLKAKISDVKNTDAIHLSLDAAEYINDSIRGEQGFAHALEGLGAVLREGIKISINAVISERNVERLSEIIHLAEKYNLGVIFQPATKHIFKSAKPNSIAPSVDKYKKAIAYLINLKKSKTTGNLILNSMACLKHIYNWPAPQLVPCYAGILSFRIDNKGNLYNCDESKERGVNILESGFRNSINMLTPSACRECYSSSRIDFNILMSLNPNSLINLFSFLKS